MKYKQFEGLSEGQGLTEASIGFRHVISFYEDMFLYNFDKVLHLNGITKLLNECVQASVFYQDLINGMPVSCQLRMSQLVHSFFCMRIKFSLRNYNDQLASNDKATRKMLILNHL